MCKETVKYLPLFGLILCYGRLLVRVIKAVVLKKIGIFFVINVTMSILCIEKGNVTVNFL